jgi:hypothetical protein
LKEATRDFFNHPRLKALVEASNGFFRPSKHQGDAPVEIGPRTITRLQVQEIRPVDPEKLPESPTYTDDKSNVLVEFHGHDKDHRTRGWHAVVPEYSQNRHRIELDRSIEIEPLFTVSEVRGDVIATFSTEDPSEPLSYYLKRVTDRGD